MPQGFFLNIDSYDERHLSLSLINLAFCILVSLFYNICQGLPSLGPVAQTVALLSYLYHYHQSDEVKGR